MQQQDDGVAHGKLTVALSVEHASMGGVDVWNSAQEAADLLREQCLRRAQTAGRRRHGGGDRRVGRGGRRRLHPCGRAGRQLHREQPERALRRQSGRRGRRIPRARFLPQRPARRSQRADRQQRRSSSSPARPSCSWSASSATNSGTRSAGATSTRGPKRATCFEDDNFKPLTDYDRFSVMHYPQCNGGGDWSLMLTGLDKAGAACLYGKGTNNTENLAQCVYHAPDVPTTGTQETKVFDNQSVAKGVSKRHGEYAVKPGSIVKVVMTGAGANAGDPGPVRPLPRLADPDPLELPPLHQRRQRNLRAGSSCQPQQLFRDGPRVCERLVQPGNHLYQALSAHSGSTGPRHAIIRGAAPFSCTECKTPTAEKNPGRTRAPPNIRRSCASSSPPRRSTRTCCCSSAWATSTSCSSTTRARPRACSTSR